MENRGNSSYAVVIPCYRVKGSIAQVISGIGPQIQHIICVDDACPDGSGQFIRSTVCDPRVVVLTHEQNQGVGGAMVTGYRHAIKLRAEIVIKIDGDGQMNPKLIPLMVNPIANGLADYVKGNRFYSLESLRLMPLGRRLGNAALSLVTKASSGYWNIFDPTNGYTAIHITALENLSLDKINKRYFFESDMLFQLNIVRAVIVDVPMEAVYADEVSNLSFRREVTRFAFGNFRNFLKRFFYNYVLRDFNMATVLTLLGIPLALFGLIFGITEWVDSIATGAPKTAGTVMTAALPIIIGFQMVLSALSFDFSNVPTRPICRTASLSSNGDAGHQA